MTPQINLKLVLLLQPPPLAILVCTMIVCISKYGGGLKTLLDMKGTIRRSIAFSRNRQSDTVSAKFFNKNYSGIKKIIKIILC